jgi:hypothetical protein
MQNEYKRVYLMDSSSLIELKNRYPRDIFPGVWEKMESLLAQRRLIIIEEVKKEIQQGDDELNKWLKKFNPLIRKPSPETFALVREILKRYPELAKEEKISPNADPFLISEALVIKKEESLFPSLPVVVTEESPRRRGSIPNVCQEYQIACTNLLGLFKMEGWKF